MNYGEYTIDDLNRYLRNGFAFLDNEPVLIRRVRQGRDSRDKVVPKVGYHMKMSTSDDWNTDDEHSIPLDDLNICSADIGCYNYKGGVVYVSRGAERQWNFAINNSSYSVTQCNRDNHRSRLNPHMSSPSLLKAIISPEYFGIDTAINKLRTGSRMTVALDKDFWIGVDRYSEDIILGYQSGRVIGYINSDDIVTVFTGFEFLSEKVAKLTPIGGFEDAA